MFKSINNQNSQYFYFGTFDQFSTIAQQKEYSVHLPFIKQQMHDMKIDKFFLTDFEAPPKRQSPLAAIGAIIGVIIPTLLFAKHQKPNLNLNSLKGLKDAINIHYNLPEIFGVGMGGVIGGLAGGLTDRKERNKIEKLEEATYQTMNVCFPPLFVGSGMKLVDKYKSLNKPIIKILIPIAGIIAGINLAVFGANKADDMYFDKHLSDGERKFKKKDLIVHVDDLFGSLIMAKIPGIEKLHINKLLPAIFAWNGYHVGDS